MSTPPPLLSQSDYEAIEAAVMETARGRWFLAEYARRNRHADTKMLLSALDRLESAIRGERNLAPVDRIRFDLLEMAKAIARTKAEIAAIKPSAEHHGKFGGATVELDSIVQATEAATSDILAAAEAVQEIAWTLREQGIETGLCDLLDSKATEVYTSCSFQDLTGQRTRKVIQALEYLEGRINALIGIWGLGDVMAAEAAEAKHAGTVDAPPANGPSPPGQGLDQADVDMVMAPAAARAPFEWSPRPQHAPSSSPAEYRPAMAAEIEPVAPAPVRPRPADVARDSAPARPAPAHVAVAAGSELGPMAKAISGASDPLAAVTALSFEEKIALFS